MNISGVGEMGVGETGVGEMGQITGETGVGEMGVECRVDSKLIGYNQEKQKIDLIWQTGTYNAFQSSCFQKEERCC